MVHYFIVQLMAYRLSLTFDVILVWSHHILLGDTGSIVTSFSDAECLTRNLCVCLTSHSPKETCQIIPIQLQFFV